MKKVSLFFDRTLREALAENPQEWTIGYRAALEFLGKFLAFGSNPYAPSNSTREDCPHRYPNGADSLTCSYCDGDRVKGMFSKAHRVEVCLTIRYCVKSAKAGVATGVAPTISVEVNAFRSGEKDPFQGYNLSFHQKTGTTETVGMYGA